MKRMTLTLAGLAALALIGFFAVNGLSGAQADNTAAQVAVNEQTQTFDIENMTCALCPVTVKKAMQSVEGVSAVSVDFDSKTAVVTFDEDVATPDAIAKASTDAGYPAHPSSDG